MSRSIESKDRIRIVAIDFDGVITNLKVDWNQAKRIASEIAGFEINSLLVFYEEFFATETFRSVHTAMEKMELEAIKNAALEPIIWECLKRIVCAGADIYLVTMQSTSVIEAFLVKHNLAHYFKEVLTRNDFPNKMAQMKYLLDKLGINPEGVLLVDDLERNLTMCSKLGVRCFQFSKGKKQKDLCESVISMILNQ